MGKLTAHDVAEYFLSLVDDDAGDGICNLKLQKLVYYAQGFHLAIHKKPLFDDVIQAWKYGPVVPSLYHFYKDNGNKPIDKPADFDLSKFSGAVQELLDDVYAVYGQFAAWKLAQLTHNEPTWKNTPINGIITHSSMREYFKTLIR